jgi:hypothetical protein
MSSAERLATAAALMGFQGTVVEDVHFAGTVVWAMVDIDQEEHHRRLEQGLSSVEDRYLWEVLANLPYRTPIQWSALDPVQAAVLDVAPKGVVESNGDTLCRLIRPAAWLNGVVVHGHDWKSAVDLASRFSAQCSRAALLDADRASSAATRYASELGVGLAFADKFEVHLVASPSPPTRRLAGPRLFRLQEAAYGAWLRREPSRTAPKP